MEILRFEGIVIHGIPFQDTDRIITLFTPEGLIKLFVKNAFSTKNGKGNNSSPLTVVEALCTKSRSEMYNCREIHSLQNHYELRQSLPLLNAACNMLKTIESTQMPGKAAPELYTLLLTYLKRLPEAKDPLLISLSFKLKTHRYEGLLGFPMRCSVCGQQLDQWRMLDLEAFCPIHAPKQATMMDAEAQQLFEVLALCRDFSLLAQLSS